MVRRHLSPKEVEPEPQKDLTGFGKPVRSFSDREEVS
jgi:hypothetical protein